MCVSSCALSFRKALTFLSLKWEMPCGRGNECPYLEIGVLQRVVCLHATVHVGGAHHRVALLHFYRCLKISPCTILALRLTRPSGKSESEHHE